MTLAILALLLTLFSVALAIFTAADDSAGSSDGALAFAVFSSLLRPLSPSRFFQSSWERDALFVQRDAAESFDGGAPLAVDADSSAAARQLGADAAAVLDLRLGQLDLLLLLDSSGSAFQPLRSDGQRNAMTSSDLKLVKRVLAADGEWWSAVVPMDSLPPDVPMGSGFAMPGLARGFTVVVNRVNFREASVSRLCSLLAREIFGFRVQANLYVTPSNASGFEAHLDWQESFVLQLAGRKRWTIMRPPLVRLPRPDMKSKPRAAQLATLAREHHVLTPGSMLYFPSGLIHEATTTAPAALSPHDRAALQAEAAKLASATASSHAGADSSSFASASDADGDAAPLPLSVHLTLGVEIDPAFSMQGAMHLFFDQLAQDPALRPRLTERLPPLSACATSDQSRPAASATPRLIDLLQLLLLELSSRTDGVTELQSGRRVLPHHYRRSLWGLHRWNSTRVEAARAANDGAAPAVPHSVSIAELLSNPVAAAAAAAAQTAGDTAWTRLDHATQQSIAFESRVSSRLAALLESFARAVQRDGQCTRDSSSLLTLQRAAELVARIQARIARDSGDSAMGGTAAQPPQTPYEFESVFADPLLQPFVQPALSSHYFSSLLPPSAAPTGAQTPAAPSSCLADHWSAVSARLGSAWTLLSQRLDLPRWSAWEADAAHARHDFKLQQAEEESRSTARQSAPWLSDDSRDADSPLPSAAAPRSWPAGAPLRASLRTLRAHLAATQRGHELDEQAHVRDNGMRVQRRIEQLRAQKQRSP